LRIDRWIAAIALAATLPVSAWAQKAAAEVPLLDPWVPPSVREKAVVQAAPAEGAALRAQVEAKLRASFDAVAGRSGSLTREQAAGAGLGAVARDFDAIDKRGSGRVSFEDYKRYLRSRGAALD
jgi:hypothetical protein